MPDVADSTGSAAKRKSYPIHRFIAAKWPAGLILAGLTDRRTLIRRAAFDLTGLPPESELASTFLADSDSDEIAFSKVVDRLLESPHYGERMAQHWLDIVRYADSSGLPMTTSEVMHGDIATTLFERLTTTSLTTSLSENRLPEMNCILATRKSGSLWVF